MSAPSSDALIGEIAREQLAALSELYDRFVHPLGDPLSKECEEAERAFNADIMAWYDHIPTPKPPFHDFRKAVILRCKRYLLANPK